MAYAVLKVVLIAIVAIAIVGVVSAGFKNIPVGQVAVKTVYGELTEGTLQEGWKVLNPVSDNIIIYDTRIQLFPRPIGTFDGSSDVPTIMSTSSDGQDVLTKVAMNYHVVQTKVFDVHKKIGVNYESIVIKNLAENTIKDVMGRYTADSMYQNRALVADAIKVELGKKLENYEGCKGCFQLDNFSIANLEFSEQFSKALDDKATAKTNAETAWNKVEELKALAQQDIEKAKGNAESIRIVNEAIESSPFYIDWLKVKTLQEKWNGQLPKVVGGGQPLLQIDVDGN